MAYPIKLREKAIFLRKKGFSLGETSERLKITKSTASLWLRDVTLDSKAKQRLKRRQIIGQYKTQQLKRERRRELLGVYRENATKEIKLIKFDKKLYKLIVSLLFWCEGVKNNQAHVGFVNSDPLMVKTFMSLLRAAFDIDESKFRILMHLHEYHDEEKQAKFWSRVTGIPRSQFTKTYWKPHTQKRKRDNYPGCVRIGYYSAHVARQLYACYNSFAQEYRGVR